jgi:hypothetical protein
MSQHSDVNGFCAPDSERRRPDDGSPDTSKELEDCEGEGLGDGPRLVNRCPKSLTLCLHRDFFFSSRLSLSEGRDIGAGVDERARREEWRRGEEKRCALWDFDSV